MQRIFPHFRPILIATLVAAVSAGSAQQKDAELWSGITLQKGIVKDLRFSFEQQLRLDDNYSSVKSVFSQFSLGYKLNKYIRFKGAYRYSRKHNTTTVFNAHRYNFDMVLRYKIKPFEFYVRNRIQSEFSSDNLSDIETPYRLDIYRFKPYIKFDLDADIEPFIAAEFFYPLNSPVCSGLSAYRLIAGAGYKVNKFNDLKLYGIIQKENSDTDFIIAVGYSFNLNRLSVSAESLEETQKAGRSR